MPLNKFIKHSRISKGQYTVTINLRRISNLEKFQNLGKNINEIRNDCGDDSGDVYKYDGEKLIYTSETLIPSKRYINKQKVLMVFGNPAFHSIKNRMFFFSRAKNHRHGMWAKLEKANLIKRVRINDDDLLLARKQEAGERKNLILTGRASDKYCLGLTTFYSFPTPVRGRFRDVQGVERLFRRILKDVIIPFEAERIYSYPFAKDAILVFVQKSSHAAFKSQCNIRTIFWPIRGKGSSGAYLSKKLSEK
jgi:hypothetical protein